MKLESVIKPYLTTTGPEYEQAQRSLALHAAYVMPDVVLELSRLRDLVGEVDVKIIDELLERVENIKQ